MTMLIVELNKPSLLTFKGARIVPKINKRGQLKLKPGDNPVDEVDFLGAWKADPTIRSYYETEAFKVFTEEGETYTPPDAPSLLRSGRRTAEPGKTTSYAGASIPTQKPPGAVPSANVRDPSEAPPPEADPVVEDIEPTMQGGGVPGDPTEAKATVAAEEDVEKLQGWLKNDTRDNVLKVIRKRLDTMESEAN